MRGLHKRFGTTVALAGVDLTVQAGEVHGLVGENGAGKSTLMKVLSGAYEPDDGRMWLDGEPYRPRNPLEGRRRGVAMIYQELSLAPHLTVTENILLGIEPTAWGLLSWPQMRRRAAAALGEVGHPEIPTDAIVGHLSMVQQQLVEIARSMATGCRVLVFDEPTSSLAQTDVRCLFDLIRRLKQRQYAVVYISHFLEEVREICDTFTVLRDGQGVGTGLTADAGVNQIISMMVGREVKDLYPRSRRTAGEVLLEIEGLSGQTKPQDASLALRRGEVLGIAGLIGAGRTELMRAIFGLDAVRSGRLRVGRYSGPASPARRWRQGAGFLSEDRKSEGLAQGLSVADNVTLPRLEGLGPWRLVTPSGQDAASRPWIDKLQLKCQSPRQPVTDLSGGNQQKVAVARLLHADVDVLLLDEPTRGIDVGSKAEVYRLIDELARGDESRQPKAILMVSSYLPELLGVCDRIAVMSRGVLSESRPTDQWDERKLMLVATGQE